jgi:hypothetical protein
MTEQGDRAGRKLFATGNPVRTALLVVLAYAVVGALAGVVWETVWTPPGQVVAQHQVFYDSYESLRRVFTGTGYYVLVGAVASGLVALGVTLLTRGRELLTLGLVIVGSVIGAVIMLQVGTALAPDDPAGIAAHTTARTAVQGPLQVQGKSPYLIWPMASLLVLALVFLIWPGFSSRHDRTDRRAIDPGATEDTGLPADRQRLVEQIRSAQFRPRRFRECYEMGTVDAMLDRAVEAVRRGEPLGPVLDVPLPTVTWREGYDTAQVRGFLDELRRASDAIEPRR